MRLAREARGVTLRQISDQTRISIRYLEAIEADDYKRLPGGIFNRSFIKAYAKQIGFDEKAALEGYMRTAREQGESPDEVTTTPYRSHVYTDGGTRSPLVTVLLSLLILAVLALGVWAVKHWYERREDARETPAPQAPATNNAQPANASAPPATGPASPAAGLHIEVTARGQNVWLSAQADDAKRARGILLKKDQTEKFDPADRLRLQFAQVNAHALEVTINGRKAAVPQDKSELVITKEDYEQLLQP